MAMTGVNQDGALSRSDRPARALARNVFRQLW
jgi:hypothetical protein